MLPKDHFGNSEVGRREEESATTALAMAFRTAG
jgi:hypothetical protein